MSVIKNLSDIIPANFNKDDVQIATSNLTREDSKPFYQNLQ